MILITKDNLPLFMEYYHYFHDSYITNVNYNIELSQIEIFMDVIDKMIHNLSNDD